MLRPNHEIFTLCGQTRSARHTLLYCYCWRTTSGQNPRWEVFFSLLCTSQSSQVQVELTFLWIHHVCTSGVWKITQITSEGAIFRGRNADKNDAGVRYLRDLSSTATSRQTVTKFTMLYNNSIYVLVFSVNSTLGIKFIWETSDKHESRHTVLKNKKKKVFFFLRETLPRPCSTHMFVST